MKKMKIIPIIFFSGVLSLNAAEKNDKELATSAIFSEAKSISATKFDISMPLRLMERKAIVAELHRGGLIADPGAIQSDSKNDAPETVDPVLQAQRGTQTAPPLVASFDAIPNIAGVSPPDPTADVGLDHVVVMSNLSFHILDKSGTSLFGPAANNTIWSGFGGACETENAGDPIVLYDQIADRWLLSQFTSAGPEFFNCLAISTSGDPTGSYFRWAVSNGTKFPDYPKYGVWSDGYYISTRDFEGGAYVSVGVYALKREDLVAGVPDPAIVYMFEDRTTDPWRVGDGLLPADIDGDTLPPLGAPAYFVGTMDDGANYNAAQDALSLWEYAVDFDTPANSSFTLTEIIPIADFDTIFPCGGGRNCIEQRDTTNLIDIQSYRQRPLHRLAYRNFGTHESLVTNQSVEAATGIGGIRWWEVRSPNTNPELFQEGTYAPGVSDGIHRWMGSIAMDQEGNIGLAYSASSTDIFPAIRYTGRLISDDLGEMQQGEGSIIEGQGSQTGSQRWGDYTSLTVDPIDDCTFWHVNEYLQSSSATGWELRVGAFKFDECGEPGFFMRTDDSSLEVCTGDDVNYDISVGSISDFSAPVNLSFSGLPATSTGSFSVNPLPLVPGSSVLTVSNTDLVAVGTYSINVMGTAVDAEDKDIDLELNVFAELPTVPVLTSPADASVDVDLLPSLNWNGDNTTSYTIELATDDTFTNVIFTEEITGNTIVPGQSLNGSTVYYWRVKANNACGETGYSAVFSFITQVLPGDCAIGDVQVDVINYDFELVDLIYSSGFEATPNPPGGTNGAQGWVTEAIQGEATWALQSTIVGSGTQAFNSTDLDTTSDNILTSPVISVPTGTGPYALRFWNQQLIEDNGGTACWDGGLLEISQNGGPFEQVAGDQMINMLYNGPLSGGPLTGQDAWCGDPLSGLQASVDINDFAGSDIQLRFRMVTDASVGRDEGWTIDDVRITGCVSPD